MAMDARALVTALLEADEVDSKSLALRTEEPYWEAAVYALGVWLANLPNVDAAIQAAAHDRPNVLATATSQVLDHYIARVTRDTTQRFTLDEDDEAEIRRMLMRAWQHERSGAKSSEIAMLKQRLGESDEIDPKSFSNRLYTLDVSELKHHIEASVPGVTAPVIHVLHATNHGEGTRQDIYVYLAKEPVSANGFDPRNSMNSEEQQHASAIVKDWLSHHGGTVLEVRMISTNSMYKNASPCQLRRYTFETDKGVTLSGSQNDETSPTVRAKRYSE
jgi:hypothetical protein